MTFDEVFAEAVALLRQDPLPPDAGARFGDLWEALQAASPTALFEPPRSDCVAGLPRLRRRSAAGGTASRGV